MTLQQLLTILLARKWVVLISLVVCVVAAAIVNLLLPTRFTATATVVVDLKGPDQVTGVISQLTPTYLATQMDVIQSRNVALKVVNKLGLHQNLVAREEWSESTGGRGSLEVWLADLLLRGLDVKPAKDSSVINILFSGSDPKFAATIANAFAQAYIDTNLELKVEPARQTAQWFSERTRSLRQEVEGSVSKLAQYQQEKGIVSLDERLETENSRLDQLNAQLSQAAAQFADANTRLQQGRDFIARGGSADALPDVLANPLILNLKADLSRQEGKLKELESRLGPGHPQYQAAAAEAESARQKLKTEIAGVLSSIDNNSQIAKRRETQIRAQVTAQKNRVLGLKKERDELAALMREAENAQKAFDVTTQRFTQTTLESQVTQTNIAVLNPAVEPLGPSFPKRGLNLAIGLVVGAMLGVGLALMLEVLDRRVRTQVDISDMLQLPFIGTVPDVRPLPTLRAIPRQRRIEHRSTTA